MIKDEEVEVVDFKEARTKLIDKVAYLTMQYKIKEIYNGNRNLLEKDRGSYSGYSTNNNGDKREERSWFKGTCFKCGQEGHRDFECSNCGKNIKGSNRNTLACEEVFGTPNEPKHGENLMITRILLNEEADDESILRRSLFNPKCKITGKCYKVIIDSRISNNLESEE